MSGLIEHLRELSEPLHGVSFRKMFGGWGLFRDGRMFALVIEDAVYIKSDTVSDPIFEAEGLDPFTYEGKDGKPRSFGYRRLPESALDEPEEFAIWARRGMEAAGRAAEKPVKKPKAVRKSAKEG